MIERGGNLIAKVVPNTKSKTLIPEILKNVKPKTQIMTDEWVAYSSLNKYKDYIHSYIKQVKKNM